MKKTVFALAAAATLAAGTIAAPQPAQAHCYGCAVGLGVLGGVIVGSAIGSAIASHPGYYTYDAYDANPPYGCPGGGYWARRPIAYDAYGNPVRWSRPQYFCR
jgi:hypothetical protein